MVYSCRVGCCLVDATSSPVQYRLEHRTCKPAPSAAFTVDINIHGILNTIIKSIGISADCHQILRLARSLLFSIQLMPSYENSGSNLSVVALESAYCGNGIVWLVVGYARIDVACLVTLSYIRPDLKLLRFAQGSERCCARIRRVSKHLNLPDVSMTFHLHSSSLRPGLDDRTRQLHGTSNMGETT